MSLDAYVTLGRSGLRVSPFTLGTMTFGEDFGWGSTPEESARVLSAYVEAGGNSLDTANLYTNGHSEKIIGDWLAARPGQRDRLVVGTKFFGNLHPGDPNGGGVGRKGVLHQLEDSLRRLRTDHVDLYWVHNLDPVVPLEETMRTLDDLVTAGKVRYVGLSDLPAWRVAQAATTAQFRDRVPVTALQLEYSLLERTSEAELLPAAQALGAGVMPWGPLRNGMLTGKHSRATGGPTRAMVDPPRESDWAVVDAVVEVAAEVGADPAAIALSWLRGRHGVSSTIVGARSADQLTRNLTALDLELPAGARARLDEVSAPSLPFPAWANARASVLQFGGTTVDGVSHPENPLLSASPARY
ncbi:aldo/keto reductase [Kineococcus terrestris]|uniref:aldo/keto reductase n=1 Tax=Kineococcus terrestris TaxID=2044856 RepID=UPI0034DB4B64